MNLKNIYKYIYFKGIDILNFDAKYLNNIKEKNHVVILNLHRVSNDVNPFYPSLSLYHFEALLKYIIPRFNVVTFSELNKVRTNDKPNIILSFDDGFYDFKLNAIPLLKKYNVSVNLNIIPQYVESGKPVWDVLLSDYLNQVPIDMVNTINFDDFNMKLNIYNKSQFGLALTRYLKSKITLDREKIWSDIENILNAIPIKPTKMLTLDDILLIKKTHEIGVHSYSHESMGIVSNEDFEEDYFKCQNYFKDKLHEPMRIYAFPSGSYREEEIRFLKYNGIEHILLVNDSYSKYNTSTYNRFTFYGNSISEIKFRALGWTKK